ncbi:1-phosphofructokinase [Caproiciproducens galactitolivorans]|uniref:Tagatose-6-phosphate kinase n=1 Tax=Caproiciproducens galactitolivorans TaxID=642589 RepID=A0ABT4BWK7_9FIRM|nr:1-phosphofructokinase [Caproiciproducens galactitolivorans]MCY1715291.1 1-phosphofructokinase [Caproiciproducens galactitolivorans]
MIYTVTFNPALDYITDVPDFREGEINRSCGEKILSGGKGINVSIVLKNLGLESTALGFIAGFTGDEIERGVRSFGCNTDFIKLNSGLSRINLKIRSKHETAVNGGGPLIPREKIDELFSQLSGLSDGDILVLAGSIPPSLPADTYETILERLQEKKIRIVVDATGQLLLNVLKFRPFLIKPNREELEELSGRVLKGEKEIILACKDLQALGACNILVSLGGDGAILVSETGGVYQSAAPRGKVVNTVGAGDSMVAGFLAGYLRNKSLPEAFRTGIAAGSASAFSENLATGKEVSALLKTMKG